MKFPAYLILLLSLGVFAGCASPGGVVPQQTTMVDVRARVGTPTDIRFDRNGDELWEYATGPSGYDTYLLRFGADGKVKEITQLITQERLMKIVPGTTTKPEVRHLLGRPSDEAFYRVGTVWSWRYNDGAQTGYLAVSFNPDDTVRDRMVLLDPSDGGSKEDK